MVKVLFVRAQMTGGYRRHVQTGRALTTEQNERAREWLRELLHDHDGSQTKVAKLLGISGATVSRIRSGAMGTSVHLVLAMAQLLGRDPGDALSPEVTPSRVRAVVSDPRYPSSLAAQQAAQLLGCDPEDIRVSMEQHGSEEDPGDTYWINEFLRARDRRRRAGR